SALRFRVYYGLAPGRYFPAVNVGSDTSLRLSGLTPGDRYYFVVTTVDAHGNESPPSNEVSKVVPPPSPSGGTP
ncbi:MAG: fibronectin type III domain-containing protein, partial [Planctomycetota bacterium]